MKKISLLFFLLITACTVSPEKVSILDRSDCTLPCWNGIVAGQTTENDLLSILESLPSVNQQSIQVTNETWNIFDNQVYFSFQQDGTQSQQMEGEVRISKKTVSDFIICGEIHTTIGELIQQIGAPEKIISGNNFYGGRTMILINTKKGVAYWYTADLKNLEITSTTFVQCIKIFDVSLYDAMLDAKFFSNGYYNAEETRKVWYPWDGYGNLDEKYPPRQP